MGGPKWTEDEIAILHEHGGRKTATELSGLLTLPNRSAGTIRQKCRSLSIPFKTTPWVDQSLSFDDLPRVTQQVILSGLLGDGCIQARNQASPRYRYKVSHIGPQANYAYWKESALSVLGSQNWSYSRRGKAYVECATKAHEMFTQFRRAFYAPGRRTGFFKVLAPMEWVRRVDELGFLLWYLDDGSRQSKNSGTIACDRFDRQTATRLSKFFSDQFGVSLPLTGAKKVGVAIPPKAMRVLQPRWLELASEFGIPECMNYKIKHMPLKTDLGRILVAADIRKIHALLEGGLTQQVIGDKFGVGRSMISLIKLGKVWKHVK